MGGWGIYLNAVRALHSYYSGTVQLSLLTPERLRLKHQIHRQDARQGWKGVQTGGLQPLDVCSIIKMPPIQPKVPQKHCLGKREGFFRQWWIYLERWLFKRWLSLGQCKLLRTHMDWHGKSLPGLTTRSWDLFNALFPYYGNHSLIYEVLSLLQFPKWSATISQSGKQAAGSKTCSWTW